PLRRGGLPHSSAHDLRKASATIAAENGATDSQLMAIYGWNSAKQATVYTRQADHRRLADDAMRRRSPWLSVLQIATHGPDRYYEARNRSSSEESRIRSSDAGFSSYFKR